MTANARGPKSVYALHTDGVGMAQTIKVRGTPHVIEVDAVVAFGGKDAAPGPLAYALASLTSCSQATAQIVAKGMGIAIDRMSFDLESEIDMSVLIGLEPKGLPDFQPVSMNVTVATTASDAELAKLQSETERRCPMSQVFARAGVPVKARWTRV
jgi:putative redox protein